MLSTLLLSSFLGLLAIVVCHELTHILIARAHGHPTVCIAVNPLGVAVVFEDTPSRRYWACQVVLPMLVTLVVSAVWLGIMFTTPPAGARLAPHYGQDFILLLAAVLAVLTSGGDIIAALVEWRSPIVGPERVRRDLRVLRRIPSLVHFTRYGRERWGAVWAEQGPVTARVEPARGEAGAS